MGLYSSPLSDGHITDTWGSAAAVLNVPSEFTCWKLHPPGQQYGGKGSRKGSGSEPVAVILAGLGQLCGEGLLGNTGVSGEAALSYWCSPFHGCHTVHSTKPSSGAGPVCALGLHSSSDPVCGVPLLQ